MRAENFDREHIVQSFMDYCAAALKLKSMPQINLIDSPEFSRIKKTFGQYSPDSDTSEVNINARNLVDVLRTIAHEMVHAAQDQKTIDPGHNTQLPGPEIENVANAVAGRLVRKFTEKNGEYFGLTAE